MTFTKDTRIVRTADGGAVVTDVALESAEHTVLSGPDDHPFWCREHDRPTLGADDLMRALEILATYPDDGMPSRTPASTASQIEQMERDRHK